MKTLHLNLKKKWFDMIASGEKPEEYRELSDYWINRFVLDNENNKSVYHQKVGVSHDENMRNFSYLTGYLSKHLPTRAQRLEYMLNTTAHLSEYDFTHFRNGYSKSSPQIIVGCKEILIGIGNPDWGAPDYPVFIIKLGKITEP